MKLQIVGGGKMGEALLAGVIRSGWAEPGAVAVVELNEARHGELSAAYPGIVVSATVQAEVDALIAVKPQYVADVASSLGDGCCGLRGDQLPR